jgi:hypothetical protein
MSYLPICKNCKYFKPNTSHTNNILKGFCNHKISKTINILDGSVTYKTIENMRYNDTLCGQKGSLYEFEKPHIIFLRKLGKKEVYPFALAAIINFIITQGSQIGIQFIGLVYLVCIVGYLFTYLFFSDVIQKNL